MTTLEQSYQPFVAEYYDCLPSATSRRDVDFYLHVAASAGDPILELGCGTGRVLISLAEAGHRICGLDLSEPMLAQCRRKLEKLAAEERDRVRLVQGSMTGFDLKETFRLIIIPFRPFQHLLQVEDQLACLRAAHRHLVPGGQIIFDLFQTDPRRMHDPEFLKERSAFPEVVLPDGRRIRLAERTVAYHRAEQMNDVELIYYVTHADGRTERLVHAFTIRYFFRYEVEHLLARCGFRVAALYGDYERSPLRDDSPDMLFVAEKIAVPVHL